jgi:hypothetical protein
MPVRIYEHKKKDPEDRFWSKVVHLPNGCLQWTGAIDDNGYGEFGIPQGKIVYAHRYAWELDRGPIPKGLQIDHLCRNRGCVNVDHMELVTLAENLERGSHPGHPWEPPAPEPGR